MRRVLGAALVFAGAGSILLGAAEALIVSGVAAGRERVLAGALALVGLGAAGATGWHAAREPGSPLARAGRVAGAWTGGALLLLALGWTLDVAVVCALDLGDRAIALLLVGSGVAVALAGRVAARPHEPPHRR